MTLPSHITAHWLDALTDEDLVLAEGELQRSFATLDAAERAQRGDRYDLMRGPESLTQAWMRWSQVSAAARERGLIGRRRR